MCIATRFILASFPGSYDDAWRNEWFGLQFGKMFGPLCTSLFQFCDLFAECGDSWLEKHTDHKNPWDDGCAPVASWSKCLMRNRVRWRINLVMLGRHCITAAMARMRKVEDNKVSWRRTVVDKHAQTIHTWENLHENPNEL